MDENLSPKLALLLANLYPGSLHVEACGSGAADDRQIWNFARDSGYMIITKDSDFYQRSMALFSGAWHMVRLRK